MTKPERGAGLVPAFRIARVGLDRRRFLVLSGGFVVGVGVAGTSSGCGLDLNIAPDASFDEVLDAIHRTDFEFGRGLSNHAPMAAETLVTLGHRERIVPFLDAYTGQLQLLDESARDAALDDALGDALGDFDKRAAWIARFDEELNGADALTPNALLARELPALVPGMFGTALHGAIRTAHAMRSLERDDTPSRRRELAFALAYWASRFDTLPGNPGASPEAGLTVANALARVDLVPEGERVNEGLIVERYAPLLDRAAFTSAVAAVDLDAQPFDEALDELVTAASRMFVNEGRGNIALLHGITGCAALRLLAPSFDDDGQRRAALGFAFQGVAALCAAVSTPGGLGGDFSAPTDSLDTYVERAVAVDDEHAFKLVEAIVREHERGARNELLAAAQLYIG